MKRRILFLLLLTGVAAAALYCTVIRPKMSGTAFIKTLEGSVREAAHSSCVRQLVSGDWLYPQPLDPLTLVPQDALLMLDTANAAAAGQTFLQSRFGQTVTAVNWPAVLRKLDAPPLLSIMFKKQAASFKTLLRKPFLQDIFSRRTVLALLPPDNTEQLWANPVQQLLAQTMLISAPGKQGTTAALLALRKTKQRTDLFYYQGISILTVDLDQGRRLHAAALGGQLVFSFSPAPLQRSIDAFIRHFICKKNGLLRVSDYVEMKAATEGQDDFFLYANLAKLKQLLGQQDEAAMPSGIRSMSLLHQRREETEYFKTMIRFSPEHLLPLQKQCYTAEPQRDRSLALMPANLLLYFWTNWLEPEFWQQAVLADAAENQFLASAEAWLRKQTGMGLEETIALFGQEFSFNTNEISTAGFFPVPRLCFVLEVRERKKAERFLGKLLAGLPLKRKKVNGATVVSLQAAKGMMQPSYTFVDDFLILADSREQVLDILSPDKKKMLQDSAFQAVNTGMTQPSNLLVFARVAELVHGLKELAAWAGAMIAVRDEEAGAKSKVLVDEVISPVLDSLSTFATVSLRSQVRPGELMLETAAWRDEQKK
ncbi:DUF3352 domain-containing protein [Candidatus Electronema halotolerans]